MRRDHRTIPQDAIRAAEDIRSMLGDMGETRCIQDLRTPRATERSFEIVGEALAGSPATFPK
jgi:uncharacterized protein with HEPN domain